MSAMGWSTGRSRLISLVVVAAVAAGTFVAAFGLPGAGAASPSYTGCVSIYTGQFRVLLYGGSCAASEIPISFGATGPPGPQGPPGPAGQLESAVNVAYEGSPVAMFPVGQPVTFNTTYATVGSNIINAGASGNFTVTESGVYRIEFILQLNSNLSVESSGSAQVRVNGIPTGPLFKFRSNTGVLLTAEAQIAGTLLLELAAGDNIQLFASTDQPGFVYIDTGTSLVITQLTSATP